MAVSLTCRRVTKRAGKLWIRWSDKTENEFESRADLMAYVRDARDDGSGKDLLRSLGLAKWLADSPANLDPTLIEGKTITLDLSNPTNLVRWA